MATNPLRGEIWLVDLGYVAKVRPCLVLNIPIDSSDRAITTIIPHTTQSRFDLARLDSPTMLVMGLIF